MFMQARIIVKKNLAHVYLGLHIYVHTRDFSSTYDVFCREFGWSHLLGDRLSCEMERWTEPLLNAVRNPRAVRITFRILAFYNSNTYSSVTPGFFHNSSSIDSFQRHW